MRSLLSDVLAAFSNVYSGWILWNLFLAFVPLALSFVLFRREAVSRWWFWGFCGLSAFIGVVGFWPRAHFLAPAATRFAQSILAGERSALLIFGWLLVLAVISLGLSFWIFQRQRSLRTLLWWLGFVTFIAFLPNAPYLLTDIIHLIRGTSSGQIPIWAVALVFIPIHLAAILLGFEAYVMSLLNQGYYLNKQGVPYFILPSELLIHALSAIGIYLGRFIRFNSWDLVTDPSNVLATTVNALTEKRPAAVMVITFVILTMFYWIMKQVTLGLKLRIHYARQGLDVIDL
jgi:uncharacterized membrane protein